MWQPWASAIPMGLKSVETRCWSTAYRGPLAIHAAKRKFNPYDWSGVFLQAIHQDGIRISDLPLGALICIVDLVDVTPTEAAEVSNTERTYGDYTPGRFAWRLENIRPIKPIPWKGQQGFFTVEIGEER
jgi:hypothetical protein